MPAQQLYRFIPFRSADILAMCRAEGRLNDEALCRFDQAATYIQQSFKDEFHTLRNELKNIYFPLDPDADTRQVEIGSKASEGDPSLVSKLEALLERANYERVGPEALAAAMESASLFHIRLAVDMEDYAEVLLYTRGASARSEVLTGPLGLWKKAVSFVNYDRVVLYLRFKDDIEDNKGMASYRPGAVMLKLFQNVPDADLEMLFPNTRVGMRLRDKLMIGIPALISGGIVLTTKLGATLVLLGSLIGFWLGMSSESVTLDRNAVLALLAGAGTLGAYFWKQFSSFKNRKLRFTEALTRNLYFKLLDNNSGVLLRILDDAEESEIKESVLALYFMMASPGPIAAAALDQDIERWFDQRWGYQMDFEIADALDKLEYLGLAKCQNGIWQVLPVSA